jgi:hypothetical protein
VRKRRILLGTLLTLAVFGAVAIFKLTGQPFLWALLLWTVSSFLGAAASSGSWPRAVQINFAAVLLVLSGYEAYLVKREAAVDPARIQGDYTIDYFDADKLLGYGPAKSRVATAQKYHDDSLIYSVRYTIDDRGLRISPPSKVPLLGCVLFFGGSVTFGEGVGDDEALPYQVGLLTDRRYRVYNFAFHGYGPHQMLAILDSGRAEEIIRCQPSHVVYQAIIPHVERAAGLSVWDEQGPRYVRKQGGGVALAGRFDDAEVNPPWKLWLRRWLTYDTLFGRRRAANDEEIKLYAEIVDAARLSVEQQFHDAEFHLLLWDDDELDSYDRVMQALEVRDLRLHRISDVLPGYPEDKARFELSAYDHHPDAAAHAMIAGYIVKHILGYQPDSDSRAVH